MNKEVKTNRFSKFIEELYPKAKSFLTQDAQLLQAMRDEAYQRFLEMGIPTNKDEKWRHRAIDQQLEADYTFCYNNEKQAQQQACFSCAIKDLNSVSINFIDGCYLEENNLLQKMDNGVIVGSLKAAIQQYPELVFEYLGKQTQKIVGAFTALNTALFTDGLFLYVPENVHVIPN